MPTIACERPTAWLPEWPEQKGPALRRNHKKLILLTVMALQVLCTVFFVAGVLKETLGIQGYSLFANQSHAEIGAAIGLSLGIATGWIAFRRSVRYTRQVEEKLRVASGAFMELLADRFDQWGLTPAERDVALFALKGLSTHDIAEMRQTSEGTVKAQSNAIYRKAGVSGRPQLLSLFIDDLMQDELPQRLIS